MGMFTALIFFLAATSTIVPRLVETIGKEVGLSEELAEQQLLGDSVLEAIRSVAHSVLSEVCRNGGNEEELKKKLKEELEKKRSPWILQGLKRVELKDLKAHEEGYPQLVLNLTWTWPQSEEKTLDLWKVRFYSLLRIARNFSSGELGEEFEGVGGEALKEAFVSNNFLEFEEAEVKGCHLEARVKGEPSEAMRKVLEGGAENPLLQIISLTTKKTQLFLTNPPEQFSYLNKVLREKFAPLLTDCLPEVKVEVAAKLDEACEEKCKSECACPEACGENCDTFCECMCIVNCTRLDVTGRLEFKNTRLKIYERTTLKAEGSQFVLDADNDYLIGGDVVYYPTKPKDLNCGFEVIYEHEGVYYSYTLYDPSTCSCSYEERSWRSSQQELLVCPIPPYTPIL